MVEETVNHHQLLNNDDETTIDNPSPKNPSTFNTSTFLKSAGLIISVIVLIVTAVVWAADKENSIKDYANKQLDKTKVEIIDESDDKYVKKYDFGKIEQSLKDQKEDINDIKKEQRENSKKLDKLYDAMIKRYRRDR